MRIMRTMAAVIALSALTVQAVPARAGEGGAPWWVPRLRDDRLAPGDADQANQEVASVTTATEATAPPVAPTPPPPLPNSSLLKTSRQLRQGPIGKEPNSVAYLSLIEAGKASPPQVNDFAAYLAKRGMIRVAIQFQQYAVTLAPKDPTLWLNLGTMNRTIGSLGPAEEAFQKAIAIDINNALAHYNLGAVYDADKKYDDAIEEYRRALVLDPTLADPSKNPQVVNNENLLAVKLTIYENQAGSVGLPLLQMQKPVPGAEAPAPDAKPPAPDQSGKK